APAPPGMAAAVPDLGLPVDADPLRRRLRRRPCQHPRQPAGRVGMGTGDPRLRPSRLPVLEAAESRRSGRRGMRGAAICAIVAVLALAALAAGARAPWRDAPRAPAPAATPAPGIFGFHPASLARQKEIEAL